MFYRSRRSRLNKRKHEEPAGLSSNVQTVKGKCTVGCWSSVFSYVRLHACLRTLAWKHEPWSKLQVLTSTNRWLADRLPGHLAPSDVPVVDSNCTNGTLWPLLPPLFLFWLVGWPFLQLLLKDVDQKSQLKVHLRLFFRDWTSWTLNLCF